MRRTLLFVTLALLTAACGGAGADSSGSHAEHSGNSPVAPGARRVPITAASFQFDPERIEVERGEQVAIELTSSDIEHDFVIDDTHVVSAKQGVTARGGFTAPDEPGTLEFYCTVEGHRAAGMEGTLVVT